MSKPTFGRALVVSFCGVLLAIFGCAGFINLGGSSGPGQLFGFLGGAMFLVGLLAFGGGGLLILVLVIESLLDLIFKRSSDER